MKRKKSINPFIILVNPQLNENIGAAARAMLNFNFTNLRIVKNKWAKNQKATRVSAGAEKVLKNVKVYKSLELASKDLVFLYATTSRKRSLNLETINLKDAINELAKFRSKKIGIVFGPENNGLNNADISICDKIINIPINDKFNSLNLAQSVLLIVYEWFNKNSKFSKKKITKKAKKQELFNFFKVLKKLLEDKSFFKKNEKKEKMFRNVKVIFQKANLTEKEIQIILGMIKIIKNKN